MMGDEWVVKERSETPGFKEGRSSVALSIVFGMRESQSSENSRA